MAERKTTKKATATRTKTAPVMKTATRSTRATTLMDYFKFGESYTSLVLGIIVVIVAALLLVSLFKTRTPSSTLNDDQKGTTSISTIAKELLTPTVSVSPTTQITATPTVIPSPTKEVNVTATPTVMPTKVDSTQTGQKTYTIKPGDDLWKIAERQYHDGYQWVAIAKANNLTNPSVINVGNQLILPIVTPTPAQMTKGEIQNNSQSQIVGSKITGSIYTIVKGDDLWDISLRAYGTGYKWSELAKANNLSSPDLIHVGNTLKIPR